MRLIMARESGGGLFLQADWQDSAGNHSRRLTEDLPLPIFDHATSLLEWAEQYRDTDLAPNAERDSESRDIEQEIGRLQTRLARLRA